MAYPVPTLADLAVFGAPSGVLARGTEALWTRLLEARSRYVVGFLASRFGTKDYISWSDDVTATICTLAIYDGLCQVGFNPGTGADVNYRLRFEDARRWCESVSRHEITPEVETVKLGTTPGGGARLITGNRGRPR